MLGGDEQVASRQPFAERAGVEADRPKLPATSEEAAGIGAAPDPDDGLRPARTGDHPIADLE